MRKVTIESTGKNLTTHAGLIPVMGFLARMIHEYGRALACPFVCNEALISRPYARLRTLSSESVADKATAQSSRRFMNHVG